MEGMSRNRASATHARHLRDEDPVYQAQHRPLDAEKGRDQLVFGGISIFNTVLRSNSSHAACSQLLCSEYIFRHSTIVLVPHI